MPQAMDELKTSPVAGIVIPAVMGYVPVARRIVRRVGVSCAIACASVAHGAGPVHVPAAPAGSR